MDVGMMYPKHWTGVIPDVVMKNLISGVKPHEKRVVIHLAEASRILNEDGTIRTYDEFVSDWEYDKSTFYKSETCNLCGKRGIREACHIRDKVTGNSMIVGNDCVYKHIEITTDAAEGLTGDEKRDYLKRAMHIARQEFWKNDFNTRYPNHDEVWSNVEPIYQRRRGLRAYARRVNRMLEQKGYLSGKTKEWYEENYHRFSVAIEREKKIIEERNNRRAKSVAVSNIKYAQAKEFRILAEQVIELGLLDGDLSGIITSIPHTERAIRIYGVDNLKWGRKRTYEKIKKLAGML